GDTIEPVAKGQRGADCIQLVRASSGGICGKIIWEAKNTKAWSNDWIERLVAQQREAAAEVAILVTSTLPKDIVRFDYRGGVWICDLSSAIPLANALRQGLVAVARARLSASAQRTQMELIWQYLCSTQFRHRMSEVIGSVSGMKLDVQKERKAFERLWA